MLLSVRQGLTGLSRVDGDDALVTTAVGNCESPSATPNGTRYPRRCIRATNAPGPRNAPIITLDSENRRGKVVREC